MTYIRKDKKMKKNINRTSNLFTIDHIEGKIFCSKTALKKASVFNSEEYKMLNKIMKANPSYTVVEKDIKKNASKKSYKGLSFDRMKDYIETQPNAEKNLIKFEYVKKMAKTKGAQYPLTKKWFLKSFPNFKENDVEKDLQKTFDAKEIAEINAEAIAELEAVA